MGMPKRFLFDERVEDDDGDFCVIKVAAEADYAWLVSSKGDWEGVAMVSMPLALKLHEALGRAIKAAEAIKNAPAPAGAALSSR